MGPPSGGLDGGAGIRMGRLSPGSTSGNEAIDGKSCGRRRGMYDV